MPQAATPAKYPSPETAIQIAVGATATNGAALRAVDLSATTRIVITIAVAALDPISTHSTPAQAPPPRPMRSSHTNVSNVPGGCPDTWVIHESGWKSRIRLENVRTMLGISRMLDTCGRYSSLSVNRPAKPRCQPSIIASANAHAQEVAQVTSVSTRHRSRRARLGPHTTAINPRRIAG